VRAGRWEEARAELSGIDDEVRRLALLARAWEAAREAGATEAVCALQEQGRALEPALEERGGPARTRAPEPDEWRPAGAREVLRYWQGQLGGALLAESAPPSPPVEDVAELRAALEGTSRSRRFAQLGRWIERGGWSRAELLELFDLAVPEERARWDLPRALALVPLVEARDPAVARELVWRLLDRVPPTRTGFAGPSQVDEASPLALSLALSDPALARRLFAATRPVLARLLDPDVELGRARLGFPTVRWLRLFEPELLLELAESGAWDPARLELARRAAEALVLDRAELEARVIAEAQGRGR
jgi:hypothetical protein